MKTVRDWKKQVRQSAQGLARQPSIRGLWVMFAVNYMQNGRQRRNCKRGRNNFEVSFKLPKRILPFCRNRATQLEKRLEEKLQENETLRRQLEKVNNQLSVREERDREREKTHDQGNRNVENKALASGLLGVFL